MRLAYFLMALLVSPVEAACRASSAGHTTVLVELYTSEGCSSCPPADRWLSGVSKAYPGSRVVPLALHVDYWDYIGWKDPYAKREFSQRQRRLSQQQRLALVYTPQVLLGGADFRAWYGQEFDRAVAAINARPARARIAITPAPATPRSMALHVRASVMEAHGALYVAAYENRLRSRVSAGENRGRTLDHDHVVLDWQGPIEFDPAGRIDLKRELALLPEAVPENSGVVAFVQNRRTAEVLQALALPACAAPAPAR